MYSLHLYYWLLLAFLYFMLSPGTASAGKVSAIIVFGDSTVDPGNNNYLPTVIKSNFPPYGRDFDGGVATGRFSNGRLVTDFISEAFGLPSSVPAYLDTSCHIDQLAKGVSFASAGAGLDDLTSQATSAISLRHQLELFKMYKEKLKLAKGETLTNQIITEALYYFSIGNNDIGINYSALPVRRAQFTPAQYAAYLVGLARAAIHDVYDLGARKVVLVGLLPLGCLPAQRTLNHDKPGECDERQNQFARVFNDETSCRKPCAGSTASSPERRWCMRTCTA
ncbi:hypothetical protein ACP70R_046500 [Stipagrostis hirtigluma subsp. patula]